MSTDSVRSFSFSSSSSDDEDDIEIITPFSVAGDGDGADATTVLPAAAPTSSDSKIYPEKVSDKKSASSCTVTDDPRETADSSGSRLNKIFAVNFKKKNIIRSTRKMRLYFNLLVLVHLIMYLSLNNALNNYHDLIVRSFVHGGPIEVRVKSFKLSAFSSTSWISRRINAEGDLCLQVKNVLLRDHVIYDPVEVSVTHNGMVLSSNTKRHVVQAPGGTSTLSVFVVISIDSYAVHKRFVTPDDVASFDVFVRANVTELKSKKWSDSLLYSCSDVRVQFPHDNSVMAEMINEKPVICQCQSDRRRKTEIPGSKFNAIMKKIQGIVKVFF